MQTVVETPKTDWQPVLAMALMQGAIVLCWIVYRMYIPDLLGQFGFPKDSAVVILAIEGFLAVLIEPLFGSLSDRQKTLWGLKGPFVTIGVLLSAGLLFVLPSIVLLGNPDSIRWLFIALVILWAMAMAMFRSPMLARLGEFACQRDWPYAASVLTLVGTLAGTLALPASKQLVKGLGAGTAFAISSMILLLSATLLNRSQTTQVRLPAVTADDRQPAAKNLFLVALTGCTITMGVILTQQLIGLVGKEQTPVLMTLFLAVQLITVLPIGLAAKRWGNLQTMLGGLIVLAIGFLMLVLPGIHAVAVLLLGVGMSCVGVGTIPFALSMVPLSRGGLGIGFYFGGAALAGALFNVFMSVAQKLPLFPSWTVGLVSLAIAMVALWSGRSMVVKQDSPLPNT
jgi:MFS family permease